MISTTVGRLQPGRAQAYQQGDLDGLCGLYAVVNALRLASHQRHQLDPAQCQRLFRTGIELIAARGRLAAVMRNGMDLALQRALLKRLAAQVADEVGLKLVVRRPWRGQQRVRHAAVAETLIAALERGATVLLTLGGAHSHCTVLWAHTASSWLLFDSGGLRRLSKEGCGSPRSRKRHRIDAASIELIELPYNVSAI